MNRNVWQSYGVNVVVLQSDQRVLSIARVDLLTSAILQCITSVHDWTKLGYLMSSALFLFL